MTSPSNHAQQQLKEEDLLFPATSAPLLAAAFIIEQACKKQNDRFMQCKSESKDPSDCISDGDAVDSCVGSLFEKIRASPCQQLFERFWKCLDMNNQDFIFCRDEEITFHNCAKEHLGLNKRLWKGVRPEEGFKDEGDLPAFNSWRYRYHAWQHKR